MGPRNVSRSGDSETINYSFLFTLALTSFYHMRAVLFTCVTTTYRSPFGSEDRWGGAWLSSGDEMIGD